MRYLLALSTLSVLLLCCPSALAAEVQSVTTAVPGPLVNGNVPVGASDHSIGDSGKAAPSGAFVGTSDAQQVWNKSFDAPAYPCTTITVSATLSYATQCIYIDATSNDVTLTAPAGSTVADRRWDLQRVDGGTHVISFVLAAGESIDIPGVGTRTSFTIDGQFDDVTVRNNNGGSTWRVQ